LNQHKVDHIRWPPLLVILNPVDWLEVHQSLWLDQQHKWLDRPSATQLYDSLHPDNPFQPPRLPKDEFLKPPHPACRGWVLWVPLTPEQVPSLGVLCIQTTPRLIRRVQPHHTEYGYISTHRTTTESVYGPGLGGSSLEGLQHTN